MTAIMICLSDRETDDFEDNAARKLLSILLNNHANAREKNILTSEFAIPMTNEFESEVEKMCNISAGMIEKAMKKAEKKVRDKERLNNIRTLMQSLNFTYDQVATALRLSPTERAKFRKLIELS